MAHPWLHEENFETGALTSGTSSEVDTESRLDFAHYADLAKIPGTPMPFRGAYVCRVNLANDGTPADAYVQETGDFDTSAEGTIHVRMYFWVSADITMATTNEFAIFQLWSSTNTVEAGAYINYTTANGLRIGIGETSASSFKALSTGQWHCLELAAHLDDGGSNDGTLDARLDGGAFTQVASLDQGAITSAVYGVLAQDAGTTAGHVYIDQVVADDARIFPIHRRWHEQVTITKSTHLLLGRGTIDNMTLEDGGSNDCVCRVFDTDKAYVSDEFSYQGLVKTITADDFVDPAGMPIHVDRGAFLQLSGTNPAVTVKLCGAVGYGSEGAIRNVGNKRIPHALEG